MAALRTLLQRLQAFFNREVILSELGSGLATTIWGVLAFTAAPGGVDWPSVDLFIRVAPSHFWGAMGVFLGLGQMFLFRIIDDDWRTPWLRWIAAFFVAWIWGGVTVGAARFAPWPPGWGAYFSWWIVNVYLIFRIFWTHR